MRAIISAFISMVLGSLATAYGIYIGLASRDYPRATFYLAMAILFEVHFYWLVPPPTRTP